MSQNPEEAGSFKPVIASSPDLTKPMMDKEHAKYAVTRATAMLGFYRKDDAWDPEMFLTGLCRVGEIPRQYHRQGDPSSRRFAERA